MISQIGAKQLWSNWGQFRLYECISEMKKGSRSGYDAETDEQSAVPHGCRGKGMRPEMVALWAAVELFPLLLLLRHEGNKARVFSQVIQLSVTFKKRIVREALIGGHL
jgi:hypothetical protein